MSMTVSQLIEELKAMPNHQAPVQVLTSEVWEGGDGGDYIKLGILDALPADRVTHEGGFVLIKSE